MLISKNFLTREASYKPSYLISWSQSGPLGTALPEVGRQNSIAMGMAGIYAPPNGIGVSELSQRQQQLHANWPASEAFDELPHRLGHLVPFSDPLL